MMRKVMIVLVYVAAALLAGCSKPPECGDEAVTSLVRQIASEQLNVDKRPAGAKLSSLPPVNLVLSDITKEGYDKEVQKWTCQGKLAVQAPPDALTAINSHVEFLKGAKNPSAEQQEKAALAKAFLGVDVTPELHPIEEQLAMIYESQNWRHMGPADFQTMVKFTSQLEEGNKDRVIVTVAGAQALSLYSDALQAAYVRMDATTKSKVTNLVMSMSECKTAIAENYALGGEPKKPNAWGCETGKLPDVVASLSTDQNGVISVTAKNIGPEVDGKALTLLPASENGAPLSFPPANPGNPDRWICGGPGTTIPAKYLPEPCQPAPKS